MVAEEPKPSKPRKRRLPCSRGEDARCERRRRVHGRPSGTSARCAGPSLRPAGAMAPRNTTQYLMELVYRDLSRGSARWWDTPRGVSELSGQSNGASAQAERLYPGVYSSPRSDDEMMDFQRRDFEAPRADSVRAQGKLVALRHSCPRGLSPARSRDRQTFKKAIRDMNARPPEGDDGKSAVISDRAVAVFPLAGQPRGVHEMNTNPLRGRVSVCSESRSMSTDGQTEGAPPCSGRIDS
ncbi:hypothetical protein P4O66_002281 [Electrophorus voltai]|uniref:Uncharacterized protein n=1 Tax=Electrophorus voltai TaxID=2609070 RepID=A0AAD9DP41_9TELE|nr:hypothetical protein P4O66_002281 [Electrophorus voltai]